MYAQIGGKRKLILEAGLITSDAAINILKKRKEKKGICNESNVVDISSDDDNDNDNDNDNEDKKQNGLYIPLDDDDDIVDQPVAAAAAVSSSSSSSGRSITINEQIKQAALAAAMAAAKAKADEVNAVRFRNHK